MVDEPTALRFNRGTDMFCCIRFDPGQMEETFNSVEIDTRQLLASFLSNQNPNPKKQLFFTINDERQDLRQQKTDAR